ncbi:hypothetical protein DFH08DRAFT_996631 [Mycena albidolilacea]|uniref:G-protein coupled receptors family 2 profile 2 domain-containing protein n=1 Tax=Mycena albidolilacea TaxID=1033008 RepID=A0AAD6YXX6_9AGAR|nr:hypothetical protein DFH08DRAFT_996631 [Mycena albidolilacea]
MSGSQEHVPSSFDNHQRDLVLGILIPGIVLSAMVLVAFAYTASQRRPRPHLHRVSFRLLVYAMVSKRVPGAFPPLIFLSHLCRPSFIFSATLIPIETLITGPISAAACTFAAFGSNASLLFSACMYFCMALNLQLVLVHGVNGLKMEKYHVLGSFLLVAVCSISPLAAGQFGPYNGVCWYSNPNPVTHMLWLVGTQSFWILLMASSELARTFGYFGQNDLFTARSVQRRAGPTVPAYNPAHQYGLLTLYPLLSCALNFSGAILYLYLVKHELNFRLRILDLCIFNARPLLYAVLAATDPSFIRAIGALRNPHLSAGSDSSQQSSSTAQSRSPRSRNTTPSSDTDGNQAEGGNLWTRHGGPQQIGACVHNTRTHRAPEHGIAPDSSVVEDHKDIIEFQI